jgi:hypothetical protein
MKNGVTSKKMAFFMRLGKLTSKASSEFQCRKRDSFIRRKVQVQCASAQCITAPSLRRDYRSGHVSGHRINPRNIRNLWPQQRRGTEAGPLITTGLRHCE